MTLFEGRAGFGEAPTSAMTFASRRISAGVRLMAQGYPQPMADRLRVACVQMNAVAEKADNLETAERLVARGGRGRAELVALPEKWNAFGSVDALRAGAEPLEGGETVEAMAGWARSTGSRSSAARSPRAGTGARSSRTPASCSTPRARSRPSTARSTSSTSRSADTSTASPRRRSPARSRRRATARGWPVGLSICYDLRFPELYRALALDGAQLVTVPARVHARDRQGPLGAPPARPRGREPVLRRRAEPVGHDAGRQGELRALGDRRSLGRRARDRARRGLRDHGRPRPGARSSGSGATCPPSRTGGRRRIPEWISGPSSSTSTSPSRSRGRCSAGRATARRPGGYGLDARGRPVSGGARGGDPRHQAPPRARPRRGGLGALHRGHPARHGRRGARHPRDRARDHARLGALGELRAVRRRAAHPRRAARRTVSDRARLEHEPRPRPSSSATSPSTWTPGFRRARTGR